MKNPTWCLTVKELQDILFKYPDNALIELSSFGKEWSSAELNVYNPDTKASETIMENEN